MINVMADPSIGIYIHFPFCLRRCKYCDFFSTEGKWSLVDPYLDALGKELSRVGAAGGKPVVESVYFGGGTPSLLSPAQAEAVLSAMSRAFQFQDGAEITLEVNPRTTDREKLDGFRGAGINRLSIGLQSADDDELQLLGRIHHFADSRIAFEDARLAGFDNISLDLIFGLPGQTPAQWGHTLERALSLEPDHLSLYSLTLERGTALAREVRCGALAAPEEDAVAEMYEEACARLEPAGFRQYEISNWARDNRPADGRPASLFPFRASRHNLRYWLNLPYLGLGAGAHGCAGGRRYANIRSVEKYIQRMQSPRERRFPLSAAATTSRLRTRDEEMRESMWLGLRLTEAGVSRREFQDRFGADYVEIFRSAVEESVSEGLAEWGDRGDRLRLSSHGRLLGNRVFSKFV